MAADERDHGTPRDPADPADAPADQEHAGADADEERITLSDALKLSGLADTGGHAKSLIQGGLVRVNGEVERRRKRKLRAGDEIEVAGERFVLEALDGPAAGD